ncbi:MAG: sugar ABC transporter permease [Firmicutes bacterium]|nr:sugar ABC transporter permease [Bacillota bacterium]
MSTNATRKARGSMTALRRQQAILAYALLLPAFVFLGIFTFYPMVRGLIASFHEWSVLAPPRYLGLDNFREALSDPYFKIAMTNSIKYLLIVPVIQVLSIALAVLVNREIPGVGFFRAAYYLPVVTPMVTVAITWGWIFDSSGVLNYILLSLGLIKEPISWLVNAKTALGSVMFVTMWKGLGYYMVMYLAGLQSIPKELEEAAVIDGANGWQVIRHVTMPLLRPSILICSTLSAMAALRVFDEVFVMTQGGPMGKTLVAGLYIYQQAFESYRFGYAAAVSLILGIVVMIFTVINFRAMSRGGLRYY